jgi:hypothetical protein
MESRPASRPSEATEMKIHRSLYQSNDPVLSFDGRGLPGGR